MTSLTHVIADRLKQDGLRVATAESCTAGRLAAAFADLPGAGDVFAGGFVTYQKRAKTRLLGIAADVLAGPCGAVTAEVVELMAEGARRATDVDIAVATTGVAGPEEDEDGNPVGLVFVGLATARETRSQRFRFSGERDDICARTIDAAMIMLAGLLAAEDGDAGSAE